MSKTNLLGMKRNQADEFDLSIDDLMEKLKIIKQRLLILLGAVLMFLLMSLLNPETWEVGPLPFIWGAFIVFPIGYGIYLLGAAQWQRIPLSERRNCVIGLFTISLLAFSFLPLLLITEGDSTAIPFGLLVLIVGIGLYAAYRQLGHYTETPPDDELFP